MAANDTAKRRASRKSAFRASNSLIDTKSNRANAFASKKRPRKNPGGRGSTG